MSELQSFKSVEEAHAYMRSHEIATSNKYVRMKNSKMDVSDVTTLSEHRLRLAPKLDVNDTLGTIMTDGIPFILLGSEDRACQYGPDYKNRKKIQQAIEDNENERLTGTPCKKRRLIKPTKKVNCRAKIKVKKVLKFPEYFVDLEQTQFAKKAMLDKLRSKFSEQTKRYIQVYVQIDHDHNHEGILLNKRHKAKTELSKIDDGCIRIHSVPDNVIDPDTPPVLKRLATLKGKDLTDVALQFKTINQLPRVLARPKIHHSLEDMNDNQLMMLYYDLTGDMPNDLFTSANKDFTTENLRLLLHLCIMFANAAGNEQTHPSIRIKGTEHNYTPIKCEDRECPIVEPHMHCPFCAVTDSYTERGLLKAHYTKQHVDKALEFSGLKILRCYDLCEVSSKSLDHKTFKGGHWHCYKCSNAYERRQDMITHFSSHLREYESSFLIHVAQDVNPLSSYSTMTHEIGNVLGSGSHHDVSTAEWLEAYNASNYVSGRSPVKRPYSGTGLNNDAILYVEEDESGNVISTFTTQEVSTSQEERVVVSYTDNHDTTQLKSRIQELELQCKKLEREAILQQSLVAFLEKKNADQAHIHNREKEKLLEEIAALKGSETIIDDTPEDETDMDEQSADGNNLHKYAATPIATTLTGQHCNSVSKPVDSFRIRPNNSQQSVCKNTMCCELSDMKKDIAELKNALYLTLGSNTRFSTTSGVQNTQQLYFIPNQGITNPQNAFQQNFTGLVNMNQSNVLQSTGAANLALSVPQTVVQTSTSVAVAQTTGASSTSSDKSGQNKSDSSETEISDTQSMNTENSRSGRSKTTPAESRGTETLHEDNHKSLNSEVTNTKSVEISAQDTEAADTSVDMDLGDNEEAVVGIGGTESASRSSPNKVSAETAPVVSKSKKIEAPDASSKSVETQMLKPPMVFVPNQSYMAPYIVPQNFTGFVNTPQLNPFQSMGAPFTLGNQGIQNSAPLVYVPNLGGTSQYVVPQNNLVGLGAFPGAVTTSNTQAIPNVSLNMQHVTSSTASVRTTEKSPGTKTTSEDQLSGTEKDTASAMTQSSDAGSVSKETQNEDSVSKLHKAVTLETCEKIKTHLSSKSSENTEKAKDVVTVVCMSAKSNEEAVNAITSIVDKNTEKKGHIYVLSAKPSIVTKAAASKTPVVTRSQAASLVHKETPMSQTNDKQKRVVLSVKGNVDSKALYQLMQKYKK